MVLKNFKEKILNQSDMYNFYKSQQDSDNHKKIETLEKLGNTHQDFLNNLFIFHEFEPTPYLKAMRDLSYELLEFMGNVCKKHDLEWWVDYDTLLGALRHRDFIPWVDDLDCAMMRKDYNTLTEIMPNEIRDAGLDNLVGDFKLEGENKTRRWYEIGYLYPGFDMTFTTLNLYPYDYLKDYPGENLKDEFNDCIRKYYAYPGNQDMSVYLDEVFERLNLTLESEENVIAGVEGIRGNVSEFTRHSFKVLDYSDIFPINTLPFGDLEVPVPYDVVKYVKDIYGRNYLRLPRKLREFERFDRFFPEDNIMEMLEESIADLKGANENFD